MTFIAVKKDDEMVKGENYVFDNKNGKADSVSVREAHKITLELKKEIGNAFFGQEKVVDSLIRALLCNGHVLLEGVPGIAKTLAIRTLAQVSGCTFSRVQFTADLLPTDIVGLATYDPQKGFEIAKGPIFAHFIIADEINRSPPKTQSALIEAMQEGQVTIGKTTFPLPRPFFVMANQNPIETEGVYSLPEAQIDRFLFKITMDYPEEVHEERMMSENATFRKFEEYNIKSIISPKEIFQLQQLTHKIYLDKKIKKYILDIVKRTRTKDFTNGEYVELGCSPRASIALYIASKAEALMNGRNYAIPKDVKSVVYDVLRHRLMLSYRARSDKVTSEKIISEIMKIVHTS